jgi:hypothetical protein
MSTNHYEGKHCVSASRRSPKKGILIFALVAMLCIAITGATWAFISTRTTDVKNIFNAGTFTCTVEENFDGATKTNVKIKNTGSVEAYVRAAVVVTWMSADGKTVYASEPEAGQDYTISYATGNGWELSADGMWYYTKPVAAGEKTPVLITNCTYTANAPTGYYLSVEIVASTIQTTPAQTVIDTWSGVSAINGTTLVIQKLGTEG